METDELGTVLSAVAGVFVAGLPGGGKQPSQQGAARAVLPRCSALRLSPAKVDWELWAASGKFSDS